MFATPESVILCSMPLQSLISLLVWWPWVKSYLRVTQFVEMIKKNFFLIETLIYKGNVATVLLWGISIVLGTAKCHVTYFYTLLPLHSTFCSSDKHVPCSPVNQWGKKKKDYFQDYTLWKDNKGMQSNHSYKPESPSTGMLNEFIK